MEIRYFGWSGVTIRYGETLVGIDLFGDAVTWDALGDAAATILCVTHGHPEHCGSLRRFLSAAGPRLATTHVVSSPSVVNHLLRSVSLPPANAHRVEGGATLPVDGVRVTAFDWKHMPLLPPGMGARLAYAASLLGRPIELARVALSGLRLPMRAPMLGFHLAFPGGPSALNYAEGLHRLTDSREVESVAQRLPAGVLMFAVEPDDVAAIPHWIEMLRPSTVVLYEAHRPWRELFGLPYVDLSAYAAELSTRFHQIRFTPLIQPGQVVTSSDNGSRPTALRSFTA